MKKFRFGQINWYGVVYDSLLVVTTIGGIWLLPLDNITWINLEIFVLALNGLAISTFYTNTFQSVTYKLYIVFFIIGGMVAAISVYADPQVLADVLAIVHGHARDGIDRFINKPSGNPVNYVVFVGILMMYASIAGSIRIAFIRGLRNLVETGSKKFIKYNGG